jgi:transcriptional activator of cad operon
MREMCFRIRDWTADSAKNSLRRSGGHELILQPKLFALLEYLAVNCRTVVTRDELAKNVWKRPFVADQAVTQAVFLLRRALRDGRSRAESLDYIQTVAKRGYRLIDDVTWTF